MLTEVRLYGWLGEKFGKVHYFAVGSIAEAIRALQANNPTFEKELVNYTPGYRVWAGTSRVTKPEKELLYPVSNKEIIRIAPAISGADDDGFFGIILGVALIWATGGLAGIGLSGMSGLVGTGMGTLLGNLGMSLVMGGISNLLAPSPDTPDASVNEAPENKPSYLFRGAVNTTAQGHPVPIGYGRLIIGSAVISAGISTVDS